MAEQKTASMCRAMAAQCRVNADAAEDVFTRSRWERLAEEWDRLAEMKERQGPVHTRH